jgi:hypothetical protein
MWYNYKSKYFTKGTLTGEKIKWEKIQIRKRIGAERY